MPYDHPSKDSKSLYYTAHSVAMKMQHKID